MASNSTGKGNSTGKWVERAATTGGGRTYRGQMPVNWYASLAVICIVGPAPDRVQPVPAHPPDRLVGRAPDHQPAVVRRPGHRHLRHHAAQPAGQHQHHQDRPHRQRQRRADHPARRTAPSPGATPPWASSSPATRASSSPPPPCSTRASRSGPTATCAPRARPTPASPGWSSSTAGPTSTSKTGDRDQRGPPGPAVRERPADHHGLRAGHRHGPQAAGPGHHRL